MIQLVQLQNDCCGLLASDDRLNSINLVNERKFRAAAMVQYDAIWQTQRNGCSGSGILIEMPALLIDSMNVSGPVWKPVLTFVCIQAGDFPFTPGTGAQLYAESIAQIIADILHLLPIDGAGEFTCKTVEPARDPEFQGTHAYRISLIGTPKRQNQTQRVAAAVISVLDGMATLTCSDESARICYTVAPESTALADSFPSKSIVYNPASMEYSAPFPVTSGDVVRFVSYREGYINSQVRSHTVG